MKKIILLAFVFLMVFSFYASAVMVPIGVPKKTLVEKDRWNLGGGYSLVLMDTDIISEPNTVHISLFKDDINLLDYKLVTEGEVYSYNAVFTTKVDAVFAGAISNMAQFTNTSISSELIGTEETPLMVSINTPKKILSLGEKWNIGDSYVLVVQAVDTKTNPSQAWIILFSGCGKIHDAVVAEGGVYSFGNAGGEVFTTTIDSIFNGADNDFVQFKNSSIKTSASVVHISYISEEWTCAEWSSCINGKRLRECTNSSAACATTTFLKPAVTQNCTASCTEDWSCSDWSSCVNKQQTRTCVDSNACGTVLDKPSLIQFCSEEKECKENWACAEWGACVNGEQKRTCNDLNKCRTFNERPELAKTCVIKDEKRNEKEKSFIERKEVTTEKNKNNVFVLKIEEISVESLFELTEVSGKVFVVTSKGSNEIKILPSTALIKANFTGKADKILIEESFNGKAVYVVSGKKNGLFLFIFPVQAEIKVSVDVESGQIVSTEKPWWSFLVSGF